MAEFYNREMHEKVLADIDIHEELSREAQTKEEKEYLLSEQRILERAHDRLLQRAWIEAERENKQFDHSRDTQKFLEGEEAAYHATQKQFTNFLEQSSNRLSYYHKEEISFVSHLPEIAEITLSEEMHNDREGTIHCTLFFPSSIKNDKNSYEENRITVDISLHGDVMGWENIPPLIRTKVSRGAILTEVLRCFEMIGITSIPVLEIEQQLVPQDFGEPTGERMHKGGERPSFEATERFRILRTYDPLFICKEKALSKDAISGDVYTAFIFRDVIIFDALGYGNAIYCLRLEKNIEGDVLKDFAQKSDEEKKEILFALLPDDFFTEIQSTKSARRVRGNRVPMRHPTRPDTGDLEEYEAHLAEYYASVFEYVRTGGAQINNATGEPWQRGERPMNDQDGRDIQ